MRRKMSSGVLALLVVGGFVAWRNRHQIQKFLAANGVNLPLNTDNLSEAVRSGAAKTAGLLERGKNEVSSKVASAQNAIQKAV